MAMNSLPKTDAGDLPFRFAETKPKRTFEAITIPVQYTTDSIL